MKARTALCIAALFLLVQLQPGAGARSDNAERLESTVALDLRSVAWRPVPGDSYALLAGEAGTVLQYTGKFFFKLQPNTTSEINGAAWNPSGTKALLVGRDGAFLEFDGAGFRAAPFNATYWFEDVKWRPQGDFALVVGHNGTLMRTDGSAFTHLDSTVNVTITSVSWRPDGRFAFLCGDFPFVLRYDPDAGDVARLETGVSGQYLRGVSWRPDGGAALVFGTLGNLFRYDGAGFTPLNSPTANQWLAGCWSSDNRTALLAARGGLLYKFEEGKNLTPVSTNTTESIYSIAYALNGSYALCAGSGGLVLRYPPAEKPQPDPPGDGDGGTDWLLLSAGLLLIFALMTVGVAVYMVSRNLRREREARQLEEAEMHAAEVAAARARSKSPKADDARSIEELRKMDPIIKARGKAEALKALEEIEKRSSELEAMGIDSTRIKEYFDQARALILTENYSLATAVAEKALSEERSGEKTAATPDAGGQQPKPAGRLAKRICTKCKRLFAVEEYKPGTPITCPWCGSPQK